MFLSTAILKTSDFKPLKHKQQSYMRAPSLFLCERSAHFFWRFIGFEQLHKHTYMRNNPRLCKYPHKHSDLGLKRENAENNAHVTVYWIRTSVLRGSCPLFVLSAINQTTVRENLSLLLDYITFVTLIRIKKIMIDLYISYRIYTQYTC